MTRVRVSVKSISPQFPQISTQFQRMSTRFPQISSYVYRIRISGNNIFPESKANLFTQFKQSSDLLAFHEKQDWSEKYKIALGIKDPRANFLLKRLIFDESPQTLSTDDFKMIHKEMHDRLVINQERPFTTIPEAMTQIDTEFSRLEESEEETESEPEPEPPKKSKSFRFFAPHPHSSPTYLHQPTSTAPPQRAHATQKTHNQRLSDPKQHSHTLFTSFPTIS